MPPKWRRWNLGLTSTNIKRNDEIRLSKNYFKSSSLLNLNYFTTILLLSFTLCNTVDACFPQYERELKYLDYYLGIAPANEDGSLEVKENLIDKYVEKSSDLNCDLQSPPCLWTNVPADGLLDTSDFYLFNKINTKTFPFQIQPGNANPIPGTLFLFAGNVTNQPQSAVLLSAPVLCQNYNGILTFEYWLYNKARIEILLLRVSAARGRFQVIYRPQMDCQFFKGSSLCRVELRRMVEPFRIGIRVFSLSERAVGSFAMLNRIKYDANVCGAYDQTKLFNGVPLKSFLRQSQPIEHASDLNCIGSSYSESPKLHPLSANPDESYKFTSSCLWAAASSQTALALNKNMETGFTNVMDAANVQWSIGSSTRLWNELVRTQTHPIGEFFFQAIDPMANVALLPQLRSVLVPCTQSASSLSFRFWLSPGVQAQLCTLNAKNVELSCVYLNEADSPGPIAIDIDSEDREPFRFAFNVIKFSKSKGGLIAINDLKYAGYLCNEEMPSSNPDKTFLSSQELKNEVFDADGGELSRRQYGTSISNKRQNQLEQLFNIQTFPSQTLTSNGESLDSLYSLLLDASKAETSNINNNNINNNNIPFSETLDCNFETQFCSHWLYNNEKSSDNDNITAAIIRQNNGGLLKKLNFQYGFVPKKTPFKIDPFFQGPAAIVTFSEKALQDYLNHFEKSEEDTIEYAILSSQTILCAKNARLIVSYYSNEGAALSVCGGNRCVPQKKKFGKLSVTINSRKPFQMHILATTTPRVASAHDYSARYYNSLRSEKRRKPFRYQYSGSAKPGSATFFDSKNGLPSAGYPFVVIKRIRAEGGFCRLETPNELSCRTLKCQFHEQTLCQFTPISYSSSDSLFYLSKGHGAIARLSAANGVRAILRSPRFRLFASSELRIDASLSTFGSRLYICPNDEKIFQHQNQKESDAINIRQVFSAADPNISGNCELVLGPKISDQHKLQRIFIQLDETVQEFVIVAVHDAYEHFGEAEVLLHSVTLTKTNNGEPLC